jgi:hypothetical protein
MKLQISNSPPVRRAGKFQSFIFICVLAFIVCVTAGCEAFVRKFTRKPKKDAPKEEMVIAPEEYKAPNMTKEELYRQYFLFWQSWQDELINAFLAGASSKKRIDCASEAINNLEQVKALLDTERQKGLDVYLSQLKELKDAVTKDIYGSSVSKHHLKAESIRRNILRYYSYKKIKDYLL